MNPLVILIVAAAVTVLLIPMLERRALAMRVIDEPGPRKVHERPMPRIGGIAMAVGAALPILLWVPMDRSLAAVLLAALIILVFGVLDDRRNLAPRTKFLGQCIGVAVAMFAGDVSIHSFTLTGRFEIPSVISIPLTFFFLIGTTNAINLADGLDGLAGGTTLLCMAAIAMLSGVTAPVLTAVALAMTGSLLGFLRYNSHPARVFMGDSGSQLLGFMAGVLAIQLTQGPDLPYSAALPLLLLGLPIIDTLTVMMLRIHEGRSPFAADRKHLHHRLLELGFDHFEAVVVIYFLQGALLVLAWQMRYQPDPLILVVFLACGSMVSVSMFVALRSGLRWHGIGGLRLAGILQSRVPWLKAPANLPRWGNVIAWGAVTVYLVAISITSTAIGHDVAWLALALFGLLIVVLLRLLPLQVAGGLVHGGVFVAMAMVVYLDHAEFTKLAQLTALKRLLFPILAIAVVVRLRFWRERRFEITPLDLLVVMLALVLPNLPGLEGAPSDVGFSVAKLVILMYAAEMLIRHSERTRRWLWASTAVALLLVGLRGLGFLAR